MRTSSNAKTTSTAGRIPGHSRPLALALLGPALAALAWTGSGPDPLAAASCGGQGRVLCEVSELCFPVVLRIAVWVCITDYRYYDERAVKGH